MGDVADALDMTIPTYMRKLQRFPKAIARRLRRLLPAGEGVSDG